MSDTPLTPYKLPGSARAGLTALAVLGTVGAFAGLAWGDHHNWRGFLLMTMFLVSIAMGAGFFIAVHYATQSSWNAYVRRVAEALAGSIWLWGLFALVVVFFGGHHLYHWMEHGIMDPSADNFDKVLKAKEAFLNVPFFSGRAITYVAVWSLLIFGMLRNSRKQDEDGNPQRTAAARKIAYGFIVFFGLSYPFAAMDWMMTLEPHWFSSIYGVINFGGAFQAGLAAMILLALFLRGRGVLPQLSGSHLHDMAKLMFAFSAFWMYTWFSQFMLIWYAHLPEETGFYILRGNEHWLWLSILLPVLRFAVPFFGIASQANKRNSKTLIAVCLLILVGHALDLLWQIFPSGFPDGLHSPLMPLGYLVAAVGLLLWMFFFNFGKHAPVASKDPGYSFSVHYEK